MRLYPCRHIKSVGLDVHSTEKALVNQVPTGGNLFLESLGDPMIGERKELSENVRGVLTSALKVAKLTFQYSTERPERINGDQCAGSRGGRTMQTDPSVSSARS